MEVNIVYIIIWLLPGFVSLFYGLKVLYQYNTPLWKYLFCIVFLIPFGWFSIVIILIAKHNREINLQRSKKIAL
jgi:hypothetical protein